MKTAFGLLYILLLAACAGGPTHDYYNPSVIGAKFKGPITMDRVENISAEKERLVRDGYAVIGNTSYGGKYPEAIELKAQAKRVGANRVIYQCDYIPPTPGAWNFRFGSWGGFGSSDNGGYSVVIIFLGK